MGEITEFLDDVERGDSRALDQVFQLLHSDLKRLARSRLGHGAGDSLTPTGLVNELYLKLARAQNLSLSSRNHFFACAAAAMRQIMVDTARAAQAGKRGADQVFVTLTEPGMVDTDTQMLALDEALDRLGELDSQLRQLVELRFFAGLSMAEIADLLETSERSLYRQWTRARAFLHAQLET